MRLASMKLMGMVGEGFELGEVQGLRGHGDGDRIPSRLYYPHNLWDCLP